jgi:hypothetical protein
MYLYDQYISHVIDSAHIAALYRRYCDRIVTPFYDRYVHYSAILCQQELILCAIMQYYDDINRYYALKQDIFQYSDTQISLRFS